MKLRIEQYIQAYHLATTTDKVLVAVSGGADSVALLHILLSLGYTCEVAHCNFHLRGEESNRDEQFVTNLCADWQVPLHIKHFNTADYAVEQGISIEMAARDLRYTWFEALRQEQKCAVIAVAHHQNDQAETLLLNLLRGSGLRGLEGMHPKNGHIIRPLLHTAREAIEAYLTLHHLPFVTDSTNFDTQFKRNAIREQLKALEPANIENIAQTAQYMQGYEAIVNAYMEQVKPTILQPTPEGWLIHTAALLATPAPETVLYELLRPFGFAQPKQLLQALQGESGKQFFSPQWRAVVDREKMLILPLEQREEIIPAINTLLRKRKHPESFFAATDYKALFDPSITHKHLTIRHWQEGDWFIPIGMQGKKKLSDFFTDIKLSLPQKEKVWLLCADDDIAWVIGYRIDDRYKVRSTTDQVAEIHIH